ncbi:MAG: class I SAM-dependent methyltransferase [Candidatus Latescibacterota bacterium]|nr:class I SAM-dependent methyltransferase [Candidatus Latescibacterota bacterium]
MRLIKYLRFLLNLSTTSGHVKNFLRQLPVDSCGEPVPWYTYPAIDYLSNLDFSDARIFEFGTGQSTLFWERRAREVIAVDLEAEWVEFVRARTASAGTRVLHRPAEHDFVSAIEEPGGLFDVVVVDSKPRNLALPAAMSRLSEDGVIIFDNSDWYPELFRRIRSQQDSLVVDFHGYSPGAIRPYTTSLIFRRSFYRNVLHSHFVPPGGKLIRSEHDRPTRTQDNP